VGQYLLHDVGSTTGTFLMIREELALEDQMIIQPFGFAVSVRIRQLKIKTTGELP
jgi:hypothetical protein